MGLYICTFWQCYCWSIIWLLICRLNGTIKVFVQCLGCQCCQVVGQCCITSSYVVSLYKNILSYLHIFLFFQIHHGSQPYQKLLYVFRSTYQKCLDVSSSTYLYFIHIKLFLLHYYLNIIKYFTYYLFSESHMFIPTFVDLTSRDIDENRKKLMDANVQYPIGKKQNFDLRFSKPFGEM